MEEFWNENWDEPWQNLLYYMDQRQMSFKQLAEASGVKQRTIESWREGKDKMLHAWAEIVVRVCDALDVPPVYMLGLKADPERLRAEKLRVDSPESRLMHTIFDRDKPFDPPGPTPRIERKTRVVNKRRKSDSEDE